jgi:integrase
MANNLTVNGLRTKWGGKDLWRSDGGARGAGRLVARIMQDGVAFYFQYFVPNQGKEVKRSFPLGEYDETGRRGLSLTQARDRTAKLARLYRDGVTDLHAHFERERESEERARAAEEEAARRAAEDAKHGTLRQLLDVYVGHLEKHGKQSARDVRSIFAVHVSEAAPEVAERKATEVTVDQFVALISALTEAGKGRTAAKLRSYLRAAYSLAISSKTDPDSPLILRSFGIEANPVASVGARALSKYNRARRRVLDASEMGAFLRRVDALRDGAQKDALRLLLFLGGQRPMQLLRVTPADIDLKAGTITLYDGKGSRREPRRHVLPLVKQAAEIFERLMTKATDQVPLFTTDDRTIMRHETISALVSQISAEMVKSKEAREDFELRDLRRTVETMLAALKVSSDVRAQILSHGLGGVQNRHYDHHDYAPEKKQALERWARRLTKLNVGETAHVIGLQNNRKPRSTGRGP